MNEAKECLMIPELWNAVTGTEKQRNDPAQGTEN